MTLKNLTHKWICEPSQEMDLFLFDLTDQEDRQVNNKV